MIIRRLRGSRSPFHAGSALIGWTRLLQLAVAAMSASLCFAAPASAQATRTWISGVGDDANPCSRTAPCKTWAGAISKTLAGGEIDCLDPSGFGAVVITKSITLDCGEGKGGSPGGILNSGTPGITIIDPNGATYPTIKVYLRNLNINGAGVTVGTYGVRFLSGKSLVMQNVLINNQGTGGLPAVSFEPSAASVGATLVMSDVTINNTLGNGITVAPVNGVPVNVLLDRVTILDTVIAFQANDGTTATIVNSNLSYNSARGILAASGGLPVTINVDHTVVAGNANGGIVATPFTTIRLSNVSTYANSVGLKSGGNAVILSLGNNVVGPDAGNAGLPTATAPQR